MNAVDTNVLVYFVDSDEPVKRAEAVKILDRLVNEPVETVQRHLFCDSLCPRNMPG